MLTLPWEDVIIILAWCEIVIFCIAMRKCRNWQTSKTKDLVVAIPCGFKSHLPHYFFALKSSGICSSWAFFICKSNDILVRPRWDLNLYFVTLFGAKHPSPENDESKRWKYQWYYNCEDNADCCNNSGTVGTVSVISIITVAIRSFTMTVMVSIKIISIIHKSRPFFWILPINICFLAKWKFLDSFLTFNHGEQIIHTPYAPSCFPPLCRLIICLLLFGTPRHLVVILRHHLFKLIMCLDIFQILHNRRGFCHIALSVIGCLLYILQGNPPLYIITV